MWDMKIEKKYYSSWKVLIHWFHCIARHIIQVAVKDSFIIDYLASDSYNVVFIIYLQNIEIRKCVNESRVTKSWSNFHVKCLQLWNEDNEIKWILKYIMYFKI